MSSALAIASVSHVLKDLLNNGLIDQNVSGATGGNVTVTALPPDRIDVSPAGQSQLNLFMYRVSPNHGWSNIGFPSMSSRGDRKGNPPLALNLHFLLTAYGVNELHTEILLGYGMQLLHETPVMDREAIRQSLIPASASSGGGLPDDLRALAFSELANQAEQIKIVPEYINSEEISKLWTAFQAKYRPSAAYMVSVVLIESDIPTKPAMPVSGPDERGVDGRQIYSFPFNQIVIDKILSRRDQNSQADENHKILPGDQLIIKGKNLFSSEVEVAMNDAPVENLDSVEDDKIILTIPGNLIAGIQAVKVVHNRMIGSPPHLIRAAESNVEPIVICPSIDAISVTDSQSNGDFRSGNFQIQITPGIDRGQKVVLFLNEYNPGAEADQLHIYSFTAPTQPVLSPPGLLNTITIPFNNVATGIYIVRIRVDGAESPLGSRDSLGYYFKPNITIN